MAGDAIGAVERVFRQEKGRVLAGLMRRFGDLGLAEDVLQEACRKALECWPQAGIPDNPAAWLTSVARNAGLDQVRRVGKNIGDAAAVPPVQRAVQRELDRALGQPQTMAGIERFAFYEAARRAFGVVQVGDARPYGCFLLRKGVIAG